MLRSGAAEKVTLLYLGFNDITDGGARGLAIALTAGALPACTHLQLNGNPVGADALQVVQDALLCRGRVAD